MKPALIIVAGLLIYQSYRLNQSEFKITELTRDNKHLMEQIQKANDQVLEWNSNYLAKDYAKRNGIKYLKITE